jgi:hypothetical protein
MRWHVGTRTKAKAIFWASLAAAILITASLRRHPLVLVGGFASLAVVLLFACWIGPWTQLKAHKDILIPYIIVALAYICAGGSLSFSKEILGLAFFGAAVALHFLWARPRRRRIAGVSSGQGEG